MATTTEIAPVYYPNVLVTSLVSGGLAGIFVDVSLHPLDTLKTRLQSPNGFLKSGGFSQLYKGIIPVLLGSAPTSALFFVTYESIKLILHPAVSENYISFVHMGAASIAEMVSCLIRVPVEVSKQRRQVSLIEERKRFKLSLLYRGYWSTVLRDMPFSLIQFSLWEYFKICLKVYTRREVRPFEGAICGALSGGIAAAITTPLDVAKTRIMLSRSTSTYEENQIFNVLKRVYREKGVGGCFSGITPRILWITFGGFIYFGVYEKASSVMY